MDVRVGLCGASMALPAYADAFRVLEVQQTFYEPPREATMRRWRAAVPPWFEFTIKAWQLVTHESRSATFRRLRTTLTADERALAGSFRWNPVVRRGWDTTLECARLLQASSVLLQCPASFRATDDNIDRLRHFVRTAPRPAGLRLLWEPRGDWPDDLLAALCAELGLTHAADPFVRRSVTPELAYYRLHGITGSRHVYSDDELRTLRSIVGAGPAYVMFNNLARPADARRFAALLAQETPDG
ncbi:MAG: hypothetical protein QOG49_552 [Frankiaceae bacterium]|nr:hypothetical protein [Frankiaceae bacterium]